MQGQNCHIEWFVNKMPRCHSNKFQCHGFQVELRSMLFGKKRGVAVWHDVLCNLRSQDANLSCVSNLGTFLHDWKYSSFLPSFSDVHRTATFRPLEFYPAQRFECLRHAVGNYTTYVSDRTVSDGRRNWGASNVSSMILGEGGFRVTRLCTRLVANARFTELNPSPHIMGNML